MKPALPPFIAISLVVRQWLSYFIRSLPGRLRRAGVQEHQDDYPRLQSFYMQVKTLKSKIPEANSVHSCTCWSTSHHSAIAYCPLLHEQELRKGVAASLNWRITLKEEAKKAALELHDTIEEPYGSCLTNRYDSVSWEPLVRLLGLDTVGIFRE